MLYYFIFYISIFFRLTVMLLTISFAFLLTTLPLLIANISAEFLHNIKRDMEQLSKFTLVRSITEMLMYINHSMNFFLYCATGQKFRHQLIWLVCYSKRTSYQSSFHSELHCSRMDSMHLNGTIKRRDQSEMDRESLLLQSKVDCYTPLKSSPRRDDDICQSDVMDMDKNVCYITLNSDDFKEDESL